MIVACVSTRGGLGACPSQENFEFRLLLMQSGTRLLFNNCDKTIITILNFKISRGEIPGPPLPLYEALIYIVHTCTCLLWRLQLISILLYTVCIVHVLWRSQLPYRVGYHGNHKLTPSFSVGLHVCVLSISYV